MIQPTAKKRREYQTPRAKFVKLEPEERLLACTKLPSLCAPANAS